MTQATEERVQQENARIGRDKNGRWQKGFCPNPKGARGARTLMPLIREVLDRPCNDDPSKTNAERVAEVLIERILAGNGQLLVELLNRCDGKIAEHVVQEVIEGWKFRVQGEDSPIVPNRS
jgi:hypothetical protein